MWACHAAIVKINWPEIWHLTSHSQGRIPKVFDLRQRSNVDFLTPTRSHLFSNFLFASLFPPTYSFSPSPHKMIYHKNWKIHFWSTNKLCWNIGTLFTSINASKKFNCIANQYQNQISNTHEICIALQTNLDRCSSISGFLRLFAALSCSRITNSYRKFADQIAYANIYLRWSFAGVFANFQEQLIKLSATIFPATASRGIVSEISFISSLVSLTEKEPMLSSRFFNLVVPTKTQREVSKMSWFWYWFVMHQTRVNLLSQMLQRMNNTLDDWGRSGRKGERTRDRYDIITLTANPCKGELCSAASMLFSQLLYFTVKDLVFLKVYCLKLGCPYSW